MRPGDRLDLVGNAFEFDVHSLLIGSLSLNRIPDPDFPIVRCEPSPIMRPGNRVDRVVVVLECQCAFSGDRIPDPDSHVPRRRRESGLIMRPRNRLD